jgi:Sortilin, neurotensin receptor 3,
MLTDDTTHYRTEDRGKTWRRFEVPLPPAMVANPLSFHSDRSKYGYILYQGVQCDQRGWGSVCRDEVSLTASLAASAILTHFTYQTYYTKEAFSDDVKLLLSDVTRCEFVHSSNAFKADVHPDLIYCLAFDTSSSTESHSLSSSRLFSSTDFFTSDNKLEDLGIGKNAKGVIAFGIVSKYAVVAIRDLSPGNEGEMMLYVTLDAKTWAKAQFPHSSSAKLKENAYTLLESTTHSLAVDVVLTEAMATGTLFTSNSNGTFFVESLKDTNRNDMGFVDYERIYGIDGVGMANVVMNPVDVESRGAPKRLKTYITYDDGGSTDLFPVKYPDHHSCRQ